MNLQETTDRTLAGAPPCLAELGPSDRMAVAAWALREQARLLRRYVEELRRIEADALDESAEADKAASALVAEALAGGRG